jgi:(p)ppGpp synthase/HD superfamily hydrolase
MDPRVAQQIACTSHVGQRTRFGDPVIEHIEHVANAVAPEAQAVAWLHDVFELTPIGRETLRACGLTTVEESTLDLLTRVPAEPYEEYISRIACASGQSGQLARIVKLADLEDHLRHARMPAGVPPYAWAHQCVLEQGGMQQLPALAG